MIQEGKLRTIWDETKPDLKAVWDAVPEKPMGFMGTMSAIGDELAGAALTATGMAGEAFGRMGKQLVANLPGDERTLSYKAEPNMLQREGAALKKVGEEHEPESRAELKRKHPWISAGSSALGSAAPTVVTGVATAGSLPAVAAVGSAIGYQAFRDDAKDHGASDEDANLAGLIGGASGTLQAVPMARPLARLFGRMPLFEKQLVKQALEIGKDVGIEAGQESLDQVLQNVTANRWVGYEKDRETIQGVVESGAAGAASQLILSMLGLGGAKALNRKRKAEAGASDAAQETEPESVQPAVTREDTPAGEIHAKTQASMDKMGAAAKVPVRAVQPTTPEDQFLTEFASQRGTILTLVSSEDGAPLPLHGHYRDGEILLDANAPDPIKRRAVVYHELLHGLKDRMGESWDSLYADVAKMDPGGLDAATNAYAADYEAATGTKLSDDLIAEEGLSFRAESLGRWLDEAVTNPDRLAQVLDRNRTLRERLRDTLSRLLETLGIHIDSTTQQRLKELVRDLGKPPTGDAEQSAELARRFADAINELKGSAEPTRSYADKTVSAEQFMGSSREPTTGEGTVNPEQEALARKNAEMIARNPDPGAAFAAERDPLYGTEPKPDDYVYGRTTEEAVAEFAKKQPKGPPGNSKKNRESLNEGGIDARPDAEKLEPHQRFAVRPSQTSIPRKLGIVKEGTPLDERKGPVAATAPQETTREAFQRMFQQRFQRVIRLEKSTGVSHNLVDKFESEPGQSKHEAEKIDKNVVEPIKAALAKHGIEPWEAGRYVYALHAPDANKLSMERHPKKYGLQSDPGSGMSNAEAARLVATAESDPRAEGFKEIAAKMRDLSDAKLESMVKSGRLSKEGAAAWKEKLGPNYVSLRDSELHAEFEGRPRSGYGSSGKVSARREGRLSQKSFAEILPDTLAGAASEVVTSGRNKVGDEIGKWFEALSGGKDAETNKRTIGEVVKQESRPNTLKGEDALGFKRNGEQHWIVIRDERLARALKGLDIAKAGKLLRYANVIKGFVRNTRTVWNPDFLFSNMESDIGGAIITIQREKGVNLGRNVVKNLPAAFEALRNAEFKTGKKTKLSAMLEEANEDAAFIGFAEFKDVQDIAEDLHKSFEPRKWTDSVKQLRDLADATNNVVEKATRLSVYKTLRDAGLTRAQAARAARETTTPFQRKGELSDALGFAYLFFNARVQGAAIMVNAVKSKRVRRAVMAMIAGQFALAMANRVAMGEDEDGEDRYSKLSRFDKYNNFMLAVPGTNKTIKWHIPRMFAWASTTAVGLEEVISGNLTPGQFAADLLSTVIDTTSPLDVQSHNPVVALTPTVARPAVEIATNTDAFGRPVNPSFPSDKPPSEQAMNGANQNVIRLVQALNEITGGDEVTPGLISLKPGSVENVLAFLGGGTGTFIGRTENTIEKIVTGKANELTPNDIPIVRKIVGGENVRHASGKFYESTRTISDLVSRHDQYIKLREPDKAKAVRDEEPGLWKLRLQAKAYEKRVAAMRDRLDTAPESQLDSIEKNIDELMRKWNKLVRETK